MNLKQLDRDFRALLDSGIALELISPPGVGKSEFIAQQVGKQSALDGEPWGFATMFLATQTPSDLLGYMVPTKRDSDGKMVSVFSEPAWLTTVDGKSVHSFKRGILFLDEYGQGQADVKAASAELLLNRRLGPHKLPEGWSVAAASNRASDRSAVTKSFDFVINRRAEITIQSDLESWNHWAVEAGVHPVAITFAETNAGIVFEGKVPEKQGPYLTPRSLVKGMHVLEKLSGGSTELRTDATAVEILGGIIGSGSAAQFLATVKLGNSMPKYEDIIKDPKKVKVPEKPDAQMLVCHTLAQRVTEQEVSPVIEYVERMPAEFSIVFAKAACRRNKNLTDTDAFGDWAVRNGSLMAALIEMERR